MRYGVLCDMVTDIRLDSIVYGDTQNDASRNVYHLTGFSKTYDVVFNTILNGFYYHFTPASAFNGCYRRS